MNLENVDPVQTTAVGLEGGVLMPSILHEVGKGRPLIGMILLIRSCQGNEVATCM
jgi:hypothetical protein